jgi:pimeloyl-ACP methyl ester carboxylesterase
VQRVAPKGSPASNGRHPTAVFLHGLGNDSLASFYLTLAPAVSAAGIAVITYDLRGHGRSESLKTGYHVMDFVADLSALLDVLEVAGPVHLVGNSFGGTIAFSYAAQHPERVASVVMIEAEPATEMWSCKLASLLGSAADHFSDPDALNWITERYGARAARWASAVAHRVQTTTIARDISRGPPLSQDQIRSVGCPVLGIFGSESDLVDQGEAMTSLLPRCRSVIVPGHQHSVLIEAPRRVRDLVLAWIAEHDLALPASHRGSSG